MRQPEHRKHDRDSLFLVAELRLERDGAPYAVKLRNISDSGVMAEGSMRVARGCPVWVDLHNVGIIAGSVAWAAGDRCGIAFDQTIDASMVSYPVDEIDLPERSGLPSWEPETRD
ncbi:PilZ domain-containing protein [Croceicoccus ponticola]|uniref:PilZ domain-containing protein n=1 Tax=Croceicoccus ponticola TaxID=2217664 RepID=A0A437H232_9SPHN|nr:PilZ domain-containing protein [Croceicoccus ponticola]RVQ69687.1 PilZ domain-containing protein [Croceicoccus ponticola]